MIMNCTHTHTHTGTRMHRNLNPIRLRLRLLFRLSLSALLHKLITCPACMILLLLWSCSSHVNVCSADSLSTTTATTMPSVVMMSNDHPVCGNELNVMHQSLNVYNNNIKNNQDKQSSSSTTTTTRTILRTQIMNAAVCLHINNETIEAMKLYDNILRQYYPKYAFPLVNIATIYLKNGQPSRSLQVLSTYFNQVGGIYGTIMLDDAVSDDDAIMVGPPCVENAIYRGECVTALTVLGIAYFQLYDYDAAMTCYKRAILLGSSSDDDTSSSSSMQDLYVNLGELYDVLGDYDGASIAFLESFRAGLLSSSSSSSSIDPGPLIRRALLVPSISPSLDESIYMQYNFQNRIMDLMTLIDEGGIGLLTTCRNKKQIATTTSSSITSTNTRRQSSSSSDLLLLGGDGTNYDSSSRGGEGSGPFTVAEVKSIPPLAHTLSDSANRIQSVHFYVHYYGFNDRRSHELVTLMHTNISSMDSTLTSVSHDLVTSSYRPPMMTDDSFHLYPIARTRTSTSSNNHSPPPTQRRGRIRVVFVSCLFGGNEPHGRLVMDVIQRLPSNIFDIHAVGVGTKLPRDDFLMALNDGNEHGNGNGNGKDHYHAVGANKQTARSVLTTLSPDMVVFVENVNNGIVHYLSYTRFAPIQVQLMGAPVTSGLSSSIDYFLSGDRLEHPFRTQLSGDLSHAEPYSEQVVLLDGQAISFGNPNDLTHPRQDPSLAAGDAKGTMSLWVNNDEHHLPPLRFDHFGVPIVNDGGAIYMCFQNLFKIHPLFDSILFKVLYGDGKGHIVLQAQRDQRKTDIVANRIRSFVKESMCIEEEIIKGSSGGSASGEPCVAAQDILRRIHFIPRVMSNEIQRLYQSATVVLHPFPFGGSKTAFDTLSANVPLITLPQKYLRGRLAATFYATMALHEVDPSLSSSICCVASDITDYVSKAIRLGTDEEYRQRLIRAIQLRTYRMYDDHETSFEWARFLTRAMGVRVTAQDLALEMNFSRASWQTEFFHQNVIRMQQKRWKRKKQEEFVLSQ